MKIGACIASKYENGDNLIVCIQDDEVDTSDLDMRTKAGREEEVLRKIRLEGGFTVFWACENQKRAYAIDRLQADGRISRVEGGNYPDCFYEIVKEGCDCNEAKVSQDSPPSLEFRDIEG